MKIVLQSLTKQTIYLTVCEGTPGKGPQSPLQSRNDSYDDGRREEPQSCK